MKQHENTKGAVIMLRPAGCKQIRLTLNGCKIILNAPVNPDASVVSDVKRMMMDGALKGKK